MDKPAEGNLCQFLSAWNGWNEQYSTIVHHWLYLLPDGFGLLNILGFRFAPHRPRIPAPRGAQRLSAGAV